MLAIPAIDLREGQSVQLVGDDYATEAIRLDDPVQIARQWVAAGFSRLHIVDLDAAMGRGDNQDVVRELLRHAGVLAQVGGGVRDSERVQALLEEGADHVVVGTRAIEDTAWLAEQAEHAPGRLVVAADVRGRRVVTRGWQKDTKRDVLEFIAELETLPLAGILVTSVQHEGRLQGPDLALMEDIADASPWPLTAKGGVGSLLDLRNLEACGVAAVVLGMALSTGALDPRIVAEEFAS